MNGDGDRDGDETRLRSRANARAQRAQRTGGAGDVAGQEQRQRSSLRATPSSSLCGNEGEFEEQLLQEKEVFLRGGSAQQPRAQRSSPQAWWYKTTRSPAQTGAAQAFHPAITASAPAAAAATAPLSALIGGKAPGGVWSTGTEKILQPTETRALFLRSVVSPESGGALGTGSSESTGLRSHLQTNQSRGASQGRTGSSGAELWPGHRAHRAATLPSFFSLASAVWDSDHFSTTSLQTSLKRSSSCRGNRDCSGSSKAPLPQPPPARHGENPLQRTRAASSGLGEPRTTGRDAPPC